MFLTKTSAMFKANVKGRHRPPRPGFEPMGAMSQFLWHPVPGGDGKATLISSSTTSARMSHSPPDKCLSNLLLTLTLMLGRLMLGSVFV